MADTREILLKLLGKETVSKAAKSAARGLEDMGDAADGAGRDAKDLDRQLAETEKSLKSIAGALTKDPGDTGLRKQLRSLRSESRFLKSVKKDFEGAGDDAGKGFVMRFVGKLGPAMVSAPIKVPLITAAAAAAPQLSAIISAAVTGGVAVGAVGIGTMLASRNREVEKSFSDLGKDIMEDLTLDAKPMVQPLLEGADELRAKFRDLRPEIQSIFSKSATYVPILTHAVGQGAEELVRDLDQVVDRAEPVVQVLGEHIPRAASAAGSVLKLLSRDAQATAGQLDALLNVTEVMAGQTGTGLFLLNEAAKYTTGWQTTLINKFSEGAGAEREAAAAAEQYRIAQVRAGTAVARSTAEIDGMNQALAEAPGEALSAEQAMLQFEQTISDATKEIKENGRATHENSQKYRDNKARLLDIAAATQSAAEAVRQQTGSQDAANAVLRQGRTAFLAAARAAGVNAKAAENLAAKLFGIPQKRTTKINVNKQQAERDLAAINSHANAAARTRYLRIIASYTKPSQSGALGAVGQIPRASGGSVLPGRNYLVGERGPELLTMGNQGGYITPNHRMGSTGGWDGRALLAAMSNMQIVIDGQRVGRLEARRADRLERGG